MTSISYQEEKVNKIALFDRRKKPKLRRILPNPFSDKIKKAGRPVKVLNLFAYTGGATVASSCAGASVCHVDASKGIVAHAKDNAQLTGISERPIRYIVDDCLKFVQREIRRGRKYDAIIMDPPSYGRGPNGEVWKIEQQISELLELTGQVLSEKPLFFFLKV